MLTAEVPGAGVLKIAYAKAVPVIGAETAALIPVAAYVALIWLVLAYMRKRGWVVKVYFHAPQQLGQVAHPAAGLVHEEPSGGRDAVDRRHAHAARQA